MRTCYGPLQKVAIKTVKYLYLRPIAEKPQIFYSIFLLNPMLTNNTGFWVHCAFKPKTLCVLPPSKLTNPDADNYYQIEAINEPLLLCSQNEDFVFSTHGPLSMQKMRDKRSTIQE